MNNQLIPSTDIELIDLATRVADKWMSESFYVLKYIDAVQFKASVLSYSTTYANRSDAGMNRQPITAQLSVLDKQIDGSLKFIKGYLSEKYNNTATERSRYAQFGIEKVNNIYKLPVDRNSRRVALRKLLTALVAEGFDTNKFGIAFWQPIVDDYETLSHQAINTDGTVSINVATKNQQKMEIRKVLNSLVSLITANNPDTFKGELRSWGFQKEKM